MIYTVKICDCYFILGRFIADYQRTETYEANNLCY